MLQQRKKDLAKARKLYVKIVNDLTEDKISFKQCKEKLCDNHLTDGICYHLHKSGDIYPGFVGNPIFAGKSFYFIFHAMRDLGLDINSEYTNYPLLYKARSKQELIKLAQYRVDLITKIIENYEG